VLEKIAEWDNIDDRERYWINKLLSEGAVLLNEILVTPLTISAENMERIEGNPDRFLEISKLVKERRKQVGLTQEELASRAGVALTVVRKIEQGHTNITLDKLLIVLSMFGLTIKACK
jgi:y4mF family transcriptional regulator